MIHQIVSLRNDADHQLAVVTIDQRAVRLELVGNNRPAVNQSVKAANLHLVGDERSLVLHRNILEGTDGQNPGVLHRHAVFCIRNREGPVIANLRLAILGLQRPDLHHGVSVVLNRARHHHVGSRHAASIGQTSQLDAKFGLDCAGIGDLARPINGRHLAERACRLN